MEMMPDEPLTPEEIAKLRALIPVADKVREEAEFSIARQLVLSKGKAFVVWVAAFIGGVIVIYSAIKNGLQNMLGG
jgi:hypothetical protein